MNPPFSCTFSFGASLLPYSSWRIPQSAAPVARWGNATATALAVAAGEWGQAVALTLLEVLQDWGEIARRLGVGRVGRGGLCPRSQAGRASGASHSCSPDSSPLVARDLCERGDARRRGRAGRGALAQTHGATEHALQRAHAGRRRLVQVAVVAAGAGATCGPNRQLGRGRRDVDVHLTLDDVLVRR